MAIHDALLYRSVDPLVGGGYLPPDELLRRVAARFPLAVIDRERGDQFVRDGTVRLAEVSAHDVVLNDWRTLEGRVAYVTIRGEAGGPQFEFFLLPNPSLIEIEYERPEDRDACQPLLEALATALEYDILTEDPEEPSDLVPDDMPAGVRNAISGMHLRWVGDVAILAAGSHEAGEPFPQESESRHWCDDSTDLILDLTGFASVPSQDLIEWAHVIEQTVAARGRDLRLVCPPGTVDERLTKYFRLIMLPIHATLAEAMAAREESVG